MQNCKWKVDVLLPGSWHGATCALLSNKRHHIIVDTGMPHEAHAIIKALQLRGLKPTDIQTVINSHFHIDHVLNNALFPGSEIFGCQESYDWCRAVYSDLMDQQDWKRLALKYYPETFDYEKAEEMMGRLRKLALRWWDPKRIGNISQFRWIEKHALPDELECLVTSGHVPGHASIIVRGETQRTIIAGDALLSRTHDEKVLTMIPHHRKQYQEDRARILAMQARILPGHDLEFSTPPSEP
jgi:glyoxylase-like metal-dependent hydrolase (beta-lactamase superfamily II)